MLDMGFIHDVRRVITLLPRQRQTLFFSATMPSEAQQLADHLLKNPETVAVAPPSTTVEKVDQEVILSSTRRTARAARRCTGAITACAACSCSRAPSTARPDRRALAQGGRQRGGDPRQQVAERARASARGFKSGRVRVLVATDIAARGIDIDDVTHVVNFDVPEVRRPTCTASAAPRVPARRGWRCRSWTSTSREDWRNVVQADPPGRPIVEAPLRIVAAAVRDAEAVAEAAAGARARRSDRPRHNQRRGRN